MSEKKPDAWMPLWIGAYLADTMELTRDEHGGYLLLLFAYWRAGAALPDDDRRLASIVKASPAEWKRLRPVLSAFFQVTDGLWWHKRVESELAAAAAKREKASARARSGANARWGDARSNATSNAPSMPEALLEQCPTPTPTPSSLRSDTSLRSVRARDEAPKRTRSRTALALEGLPDDWRQRAAKALPGWDHDGLFRAFCAHHTAKGTLSASWASSWATWLINAPQYSRAFAPASERRQHEGRRSATDENRAFARSIGMRTDEDDANWHRTIDLEAEDVRES